MFYLVAVEKEENNSLLQLAKSNPLKSLKKKKDIGLVKNKGRSFFYSWMKVLYFKNKEQDLFGAWSLPKKYIPRAVDRNRLKRWGCEDLKRSFLNEGFLLVMFLPKEKGFYKNLKRKDFDSVFKKVMEKVYKEFK